jgi:hypothetical protein
MGSQGLGQTKTRSLQFLSPPREADRCISVFKRGEELASPDLSCQKENRLSRGHHLVGLPHPAQHAQYRESGQRWMGAGFNVCLVHLHRG